MPLRPLADVSVADWFADDGSSPLPHNLGPAGFSSYVRVLHSDRGDGERYEGHLDDDLLAALVAVLSGHTSTPDDCYFGLWDGYGDIDGGDPVGFLTAFSGPMKWPGRIFTKEKPPPPVPPAFAPEVLAGPKLSYFHDYLLFRGKLAEAGQWGAVGYGYGVPRDINSPNLMWPADHAWFVTTSIEGTWTGVGGSAVLIDELLKEPRLEVVRQRYDVTELR
ncbi:hypothetical protein GCM10022234_25730 [Aeromicrobium panaciterrae]|uniref:hypothetical protein n=1 Tax=Aeromicrobium panaciterrae TaxID=363861 RepID=UPI0031E415C5